MQTAQREEDLPLLIEEDEEAVSRKTNIDE
jgi:hypothetical protein